MPLSELIEWRAFWKLRREAEKKEMDKARAKRGGR